MLAGNGAAEALGGLMFRLHFHEVMATSRCTLRAGLTVFALAVIGLGLAWHPAQASAATTTYKAEFKGDASFHDHWVYSDGSTLNTDESFSWDEIVYTEVPDRGEPTSQKTLVAQGTTTQNGVGDTTPIDCTFRQSPSPSLVGLMVAPGDSPGTVNVSVFIPTQVDSGNGLGQLDVTGTDFSDPNHQCGSEFPLDYDSNDGGWNSSGCVQYPTDPAFMVGHALVGVPGSYTQSYVANQQGGVGDPSCLNGGSETASRAINATLTVTAGVPPGGGGGGGFGPPTPTPQQLSAMRKQAAADEIRVLVPQAEWQCGLAAVSLSGLLAFPAGGAGLHGAEALLSTIVEAIPRLHHNQECADKIVEIIHQYEIYINDPPDQHFSKVALPVNTSVPRSVRCPRGSSSACKRLVALGVKLAASEHRVIAIEDALTTTSNRLSTARAAGDQAPEDLQSAAFDALNAELIPALDAQNTAQGAVAHELKRDHTRIIFRKSAVTSAIALILQETAAGGVPVSALRGLAGGELSPVALRFDAVLRQTISTATPRKLARAITLPGLSALLAALDVQHAIPANHRSRLASDLAKAKQARTRSAWKTALRKFVADSDRVRGQGGVLLQFAAPPLTG